LHTAGAFVHRPLTLGWPERLTRSSLKSLSSRGAQPFDLSRLPLSEELREFLHACLQKDPCM
jgi:hypothetical protein